MSQLNNGKMVIVGGGTAGWMTAAVMARLMGSSRPIYLIESEQIETVGVGEATLPPLRDLHYLLGIDEPTFLKATGATFKLGISFEHWSGPKSSYLHSFGVHGREIAQIGFHHFWLKAKSLGLNPAPFESFALSGRLARAHQFCHPHLAANPRHTFSYAYHLDAVAYAHFLRQWSESHGVIHKQGTVQEVKLDQNSGAIESLKLADGSEYQGDLYIDCTGFRARLLGQALGVSFQDWSHWLPCDRALAAPTALLDDYPPYTVSAARSAGWQWRIPLQNRMGNGLVYASNFISDEKANTEFVSGLNNQRLADPKPFRFGAGCRQVGWKKNCVAIGLSSGFLEPLESTSIHLIQSAIYKLVELFPVSQDYEKERQQFNTALNKEYETIRDFIILHYKLNKRKDEAFWQYCANMPIPDSLQAKMAAYEEAGVVIEEENGAFAEPSWLAVMCGQAHYPRQLHPCVQSYSEKELSEVLALLASEVNQGLGAIPNHQQALKQCLHENTQNGHRPGRSLYA